MAMKITKVTLDNVSCFEHLELDFTSGADPRPWTLVLGDNGVGKTTLLRSIALGLCDETSASALYQELYADLTRKEGEGVTTITVDLASAEKPGDTFSTITTIKHVGSELQIEQRTDPPGAFPWGDVFVCAYGAGRRAFGAKVLTEYAVTDALEPLFNYESQLQNLELMLRRIDDDERTDVNMDELFDRLAMIIGFESGSVRMGPTGLQIKGEWGTFRGMGGVGDGYAATVGWVCDMLGWVQYFDPGLVSQPEGIILLDEIEHHLHPKLQKQIIGRLWRAFPGLQFVVTSHAPLCAVGTTDLSDDECRLALLSWDGDHVVSHEAIPPRGQRTDQVLTSYLFGLLTLGGNETAQLIEEYADLLSKKERTADAERKLQHLRSAIETELGTGESELQGKVREAVEEVLVRSPGSWYSKAKAAAASYEIKRQLKELLE